MSGNQEGRFYVAGGTLAIDAESYVMREADATLLSALQSGKFCYVLNSRQMGKSSISVRTLCRLQEAGTQTCFIDLTKIGGKNVTSDQWYAGLTGEVGRALNLRSEMLGYWREHNQLGGMQRFFGSLREVALERIKAPIVIFVDEIDATRSLTFSTDEFFAAVRECFNRRVQDPEYQRLVFCMVGVAVPNDLISDPRTTPFNVGERVVLNDFTLQECMILSKGLGPRGQTLMERVHYWTGGHPYLTQTLCSAIQQAPEASVDSIVNKLFLSDEAKEGNINLSDVSNRILNGYDDPDRLEEYRSEILNLYSRILKGKEAVADDESNRLISILKLSGVLKAENRRLIVRNNIYRRVFSADWIKQNMPFQEVKRQKIAFWKGVVRSAFISGVITLLIASFAYWAVKEKARAEAAQLEAYREARAAKNAADEADIARNSARKFAAYLVEATEKVQVERNNAIAQSKKALAAELKAKQAAALAELAKNQSLSLNSRLRTALADAQAQKNKAVTFAGQAASAAEASNQAASRERTQKEIGRKLLYATNVSLAGRELNEGNAEQMRSLLLSEIPKPNQQDLRSFDWGYLWDQLYHSSKILPNSKQKTSSIKFLPSGEVAHFDGVGRLQLTANGKTVKKRLIPGRVTSSAISDNSKWVVAGDYSGNMTLIDVNGKTSSKLKFLDQSSVLAISDGGDVIVGVRNNQIHSTTRTGNSWQATNFRLFGLAAWSLAPDGKYFASSDTFENGSIYLFDPRTGKRLRKMDGKVPTTVQAMRFSPDSRLLAVSGSYGELYIYDVQANMQVYANERLRNSIITSICFAQDGILFGTGGRDGMIQTWGISRVANGISLVPRESLLGNTEPVSLLEFDAEGDNLVSVSSTGTTRLWEIGQRTIVRQCANYVSYDLSGNLMVSGVGPVGAVKNLKTGVLIQLSPPEGLGNLSYVISPNGKWVGVGQSKRTNLGLQASVSIYDASNGKIVWTTKLLDTIDSRDVAENIQFSPDSKSLVVGLGAKQWYSNGLPGYVMILDSQSGKVLKTLKDMKNKVTSLTFDPAGKVLWVSSQDSSVYAYDTNKWSLLRSIPFTETPTALAISKDGSKLAVGDISGIIHINTVLPNANLVYEKNIRSRSSLIAALDFHPDGRTLASGGVDRKLTLWNLETSLPTLTFGGFDRLLLGMKFSPNGQVLATGFNSKRCWITSTSPETLASDLNGILAADLELDETKLERAMQQARATKKKVFVVLLDNVESTYSGLLDAFVNDPATRKILEPYFVFVKLRMNDKDFGNKSFATEEYRKYVGANTSSVPAYFFMDGKGIKLRSSMVDSGPYKGRNVGVPTEDWEIKQFLADLKSLAPALSTSDLNTLSGLLKG